MHFPGVEAKRHRQRHRMGGHSCPPEPCRKNVDRDLAYIIPGHFAHHVSVLPERYCRRIFSRYCGACERMAWTIAAFTNRRNVAHRSPAECPSRNFHHEDKNGLLRSPSNRHSCTVGLRRTVVDSVREVESFLVTLRVYARNGLQKSAPAMIACRVS